MCFNINLTGSRRLTSPITVRETLTLNGNIHHLWTPVLSCTTARVLKPGPRKIGVPLKGSCKKPTPTPTFREESMPYGKLNLKQWHSDHSSSFVFTYRFCIETPRPGARLLQRGDERLLKLAAKRECGCFISIQGLHLAKSTSPSSRFSQNTIYLSTCFWGPGKRDLSILNGKLWNLSIVLSRSSMRYRIAKL